MNENNDITKYSDQTFEGIKHINEHGQEFWYARELHPILGYTQWRNFMPVVEKAKTACEASKTPTLDHFADVSKMVNLGSGSERKIDDIMLSRYACYLIVMNGDPRKEVIAIGQTYFAVKTRQQELIDNYDQLTEDQKRLAIREEMTIYNKLLAEAAKKAGVKTSKQYAVFQNRGYQGLYGGLSASDIHARKKLEKGQQILDHMGSAELAANLFRATQTDEKLRNENITRPEDANEIHYEVGKRVRKTIKDLKGTMPENLPTPEKSIKQIKKSSAKKQITSKKSKKPPKNDT